ncbi:MAG: hypothetical protein KAY37_00100 [Phycisphaerae bacterium]|nr:hypothetical protein [Phycisphaerae bacterium]
MLFPLLLFPLLLLSGCRRQPIPEPELVRDIVERGPLKFTVEAGPLEAQVGDSLTVTLTVETPTGYSVSFPTEEAFGDLDARAIDAPNPRPTSTGMLWRRDYAFEPLFSGLLEIPPLTVRYAPPETSTQPLGRHGGRPLRHSLEHELVSNAIQLEVRSALTESDSPDRPRDITGTLLTPKPPRSAWHWAVLAAANAGAFMVAMLIYRTLRRRALRPPPPILPEVWALRALEELAAGTWLEQGRKREYYYRLTEIVRSYIERKFSLAAPEMTTEEFLAALARDQRALPYDADRLRLFLEACDIVKYAAGSARREDAEAALAMARAFVHATAASSVRPPSPTSSSVAPPSPTSSTPPGGQAA